MGIGETLCHHKGDESCTCADIKDMLSTLSPGTKQQPVRTHFHGRTVLFNVELFQRKIVTHERKGTKLL